MESHKENLKSAKEWYKIAKEQNNQLAIEILEKHFPELKESEDERIRKFISNELACLRATDEKGSDRYEELTGAIAWLEKQGETSYNPYKTTVEAIAEMCERYSQADSDFKDFLNNVKVKCKDAIEYDTIWIEKQGEQKPSWSEEDELHLTNAILAAENEWGISSFTAKWLKSLKERLVLNC